MKGTPSFRTTAMSRSAFNFFATSAATGAPPRGSPEHKNIGPIRVRAESFRKALSPVSPVAEPHRRRLELSLGTSVLKRNRAPSRERPGLGRALPERPVRQCCR